MMALLEDQYNLIIEKCSGSAIDAVWEMFNPLHTGWTRFPHHLTTPFEQRKSSFFEALKMLLDLGEIKLHKRGVWLTGTCEQQLLQLENAFPTSEEDADQRCTKPGFEAPYPGFGMNVWWFLDICPAGVAWRQPDGSYLIAD